MALALNLSKRPTQYLETDVALVGAGIMSATLAVLLARLDPDLRIAIFERLPQPAEESSSPWNNAGTGHGGMCELNYSVEQDDGSVDVSKAININEQFQVSRQLWAQLVEAGVLAEPKTFINSTAHMSFVTGDANVAYMRARFAALHQSPLFSSMQYSEDPAQIGAWSPLLIQNRAPGEAMAATYDPEGTDINFGALTREYLRYVASCGANIEYSHQVTGLRRCTDGRWLLETEHTGGAGRKLVKAKRVFIGAGGYALGLLQQAGLPEVDGYGLFPISGQFLTTAKPELVAQHSTKVYGKAAVGAPPMSVPHLDARVIDGDKYILFGPFAGSSPKFLKRGSLLDLPASLRTHNILPMLQVAQHNLDLVKYLMTQIFLPPQAQLEALAAFLPSADLSDWTMLTAGQRAQIIKPDANGKGTLQFGTELVTAADGSIAGVLGASPGASTAVPIMLNVLERLWADRMGEWRPVLQEMIPTWGTKLNSDAKLAQTTRARTAEVLGTVAPQ